METVLSVSLTTAQLPATEYIIEIEIDISDEEALNELKSILDNDSSFPYEINHVIEIFDANLTTGKHIPLWTSISIQSYQGNSFSLSWNDKQSAVCFSPIFHQNFLLWLLPMTNQLYMYLKNVCLFRGVQWWHKKGKKGITFSLFVSQSAPPLTRVSSANVRKSFPGHWTAAAMRVNVTPSLLTHADASMPSHPMDHSVNCTSHTYNIVLLNSKHSGHPSVCKIITYTITAAFRKKISFVLCHKLFRDIFCNGPVLCDQYYWN